METLQNIDVNLMVALIILLITGYLLYKIISNPIKSIKIIIGALLLILLGTAAWAGVLFFVLYV